MNDRLEQGQHLFLAVAVNDICPLSIEIYQLFDAHIPPTLGSYPSFDAEADFSARRAVGHARFRWDHIHIFCYKFGSRYRGRY